MKAVINNLIIYDLGKGGDLKKLLSLFFIFVFILNTQIPAFSIFKKEPSPIDSCEKLSYINLDFWKRFNDPYLEYYIIQAISNNPDAKKASWKVEEYRQNIKSSFAKELPSLSVSTNYAGLKIPKLDNFELDQNALLVPFIASYEPDFLLKKRDKTKSAKKSYESVKFDERAVYISLASDVACVYLNLLQYDKLIKLQEKVIFLNKEELRLEKLLFEEGAGDKFSLNTSKKDLINAQNNLEIMYKDRFQLLTQLAFLTGDSPLCIDDYKRLEIDVFDYYSTLPDKFSSDIIFSRPDVLSAEAKLQKAGIDVRIARKEFYPSFYITGFLMFNTIAPGNFFSWESILASVLAGFSQDIFKGGAKIAKLKINKAKYEQAFQDYTKSDLQAVKEINDALIVIRHDTDVDKNLLNYLKYQNEDFRNMQHKYSNGVISYLDLLGEKEKLMNISQNQTKTKTARIMDYFTLYKVVGAQL